MIIDDGFPTDLKSREDFSVKALKQMTQLKNQHSDPFDIIVNDPCGSFDIGPSLKIFSMLPEKSQIRTLYTKRTEDLLKEKYIVIHNHSISQGKTLPFLNHFKYPYPVVQVGGPNDELIEGRIDFRGKPFEEVRSVIENSQLFIGVHSSMTCFSSYIPNVKGIACHFCNTGLHDFGEYNKNFTDVKFDDCTDENIIKIIKEKLNND